MAGTWCRPNLSESWVLSIRVLETPVNEKIFSIRTAYKIPLCSLYFSLGHLIYLGKTGTFYSKFTYNQFLLRAVNIHYLRYAFTDLFPKPEHRVLDIKNPLLVCGHLYTLFIVENVT